MAFINVRGLKAPLVIQGVSEGDPYINGFLDPNVEHEPGFQTFCRNYLPRDAVVLDIGANIGVTSLILSAHLTAGEVHAVEGAKRVFAALEANLAQNKVSNVYPHRLAISDANGIVEFVDNSAYGHIADLHDGALAKDPVEAITIDDLVDRLGLTRLDFIKVDIEGHEPQLFAGAQRTLARFSPTVLFELNSWAMLVNTKVNPLDFLRDVARRFPHVYRVARDPNDRTGIEPIVADPEGTARWLLHDNVVHFGSVNDIVVSARPLVYTEEQRLRDDLVTRDLEIEALRRELQAARADIGMRDSEASAAFAELSRRHAAAEGLLEHETARAFTLTLEVETLHTEIQARLAELALLSTRVEADGERLTELEQEVARLRDELHANRAIAAVCRARAEGLTGDWSLRTVMALRASAPLPTLPGDQLDDAGFVTTVFRDLLGREPDDSGLHSYLRRLQSGRSRMSVLADVVSSPEFRARAPGPDNPRPIR